MQRLQMTQNMKPYRKDTDPPEGMTMPREPARQIQVLYIACFVSRALRCSLLSADWVGNHLRMAKVIPIIVSLENRCSRWPSTLAGSSGSVNMVAIEGYVSGELRDIDRLWSSRRE